MDLATSDSQPIESNDQSNVKEVNQSFARQKKITQFCNEAMALQQNWSNFIDESLWG